LFSIHSMNGGRLGPHGEGGEGIRSNTIKLMCVCTNARHTRTHIHTHKYTHTHMHTHTHTHTHTCGRPVDTTPRRVGWPATTHTHYTYKHSSSHTHVRSDAHGQETHVHTVLCTRIPAGRNCFPREQGNGQKYSFLVEKQATFPSKMAPLALGRSVTRLRRPWSRRSLNGTRSTYSE